MLLTTLQATSTSELFGVNTDSPAQRVKSVDQKTFVTTIFDLILKRILQNQIGKSKEIVHQNNSLIDSMFTFIKSSQLERMLMFEGTIQGYLFGNLIHNQEKEEKLNFKQQVDFSFIDHAYRELLHIPKVKIIKYDIKTIEKKIIDQIRSDVIQQFTYNEIYSLNDHIFKQKVNIAEQQKKQKQDICILSQLNNDIFIYILSTLVQKSNQNATLQQLLELNSSLEQCITNIQQYNNPHILNEQSQHQMNLNIEDRNELQIPQNPQIDYQKIQNYITSSNNIEEEFILKYIYYIEELNLANNSNEIQEIDQNLVPYIKSLEQVQLQATFKHFGLNSPGNASCYINSLLQAFFQMDAIRNKIIEMPKDQILKQKDTDNMKIQLQRLFAKMYACDNGQNYIMTEDFINSIPDNRFKYGLQQQDCCEFFEYLNGVLEDINIDDNYSLHYQQIFQCQEQICFQQHQVQKFEIKLYLTLTQNENNIQDMLNNLYETQQLSGYTCTGICKLQNQVQKMDYLYHSPNYIIMQILIFEGQNKIIDKFIKILNTIQVRTEQQDKSETYSVQSIIFHRGLNRNSGHYITFAQNENNIWFRYDDKSVKEFNKFSQEELDQQVKNEKNYSSLPYLVIYKKESLKEQKSILSVSSNIAQYVKEENLILENNYKKLTLQKLSQAHEFLQNIQFKLENFQEIEIPPIAQNEPESLQQTVQQQIDTEMDQGQNQEQMQFIETQQIVEFIQAHQTIQGPIPFITRRKNLVGNDVFKNQSYLNSVVQCFIGMQSFNQIVRNLFYQIQLAGSLNQELQEMLKVLLEYYLLLLDIEIQQKTQQQYLIVTPIDVVRKFFIQFSTELEPSYENFSRTIQTPKTYLFFQIFLENIMNDANYIKSIFAQNQSIVECADNIIKHFEIVYDFKDLQCQCAQEQYNKIFLFIHSFTPDINFFYNFTLEDSVTEYLQKCHCQELRNSRTIKKIKETPQILCIQYDRMMKLEKDPSFNSFPSQYIFNESKYKLFAVIVHQGKHFNSPDSKYYSYVKYQDNYNDDLWIKIDDENGTDPFQQIIVSDIQEIRSEQALNLFYIKEDNPQKVVIQVDTKQSYKDKNNFSWIKDMFYAFFQEKIQGESIYDGQRSVQEQLTIQEERINRFIRDEALKQNLLGFNDMKIMQDVQNKETLKIENDKYEEEGRIRRKQIWVLKEKLRIKGILEEDERKELKELESFKEKKRFSQKQADTLLNTHYVHDTKTREIVTKHSGKKADQLEGVLENSNENSNGSNDCVKSPQKKDNKQNNTLIEVTPQRPTQPPQATTNQVTMSSQLMQSYQHQRKNSRQSQFNKSRNLLPSGNQNANKSGQAATSYQNQSYKQNTFNSPSNTASSGQERASGSTMTQSRKDALLKARQFNLNQTNKNTGGGKGGDNPPNKPSQPQKK